MCVSCIKIYEFVLGISYKEIYWLVIICECGVWK